MRRSVLDTDILSDIIRPAPWRQAVVMRRAGEYLAFHGEFTFSELSRFEIVRGLRTKDARRQLQRFDAFCEHCVRLPVSAEVLDLAAILWARGRRSSLVVGDCDAIIAAPAIQHELSLVTANTRHYSWIPDLELVNWREP